MGIFSIPCPTLYVIKICLKDKSGLMLSPRFDRCVFPLKTIVFTNLSIQFSTGSYCALERAEIYLY